jgi:hypothetical protein
MKTIINKVHKTINKYEVEILAVIFTSVLMGSFAYTLLIAIEQAFA